MGFKPRYVRLYAKPRSAPGWWPRNVEGRPSWVLVYVIGGAVAWTVDVTDPSRTTKVPVGDVKALQEDFEDIHERKFRWHVVRRGTWDGLNPLELG